MSDKCVGGGRTIIEIESPGDCTECVGVQKVVNNPDGTSTMTFTNGQSITYISKGDDGEPGAKGDKGDVGATMFHNKYPLNSTAGLTGAFEIMDTAQLPANALANAGDQCTVRFLAKCGDVILEPNGSLNQEIQVTLNGVKIGVGTIVFNDIQVNVIDVVLKITRIDKNNAHIEGYFVASVTLFGGNFGLPPVPVTSLEAKGGLDFSIAQAINAEAKTDVAETVPVQCVNFYCEYKKLA